MGVEGVRHCVRGQWWDRHLRRTHGTGTRLPQWGVRAVQGGEWRYRSGTFINSSWCISWLDDQSILLSQESVRYFGGTQNRAYLRRLIAYNTPSRNNDDVCPREKLSEARHRVGEGEPTSVHRLICWISTKHTISTVETSFCMTRGIRPWLIINR